MGAGAKRLPTLAEGHNHMTRDRTVSMAVGQTQWIRFFSWGDAPGYGDIGRWPRASSSFCRLERALRLSILTAVFLSGCGVSAPSLLSGAAAAAESGRPVHQVLTDRSSTLMLDYFQQLAATLPPEEPHSFENLEHWEQRRAQLRAQLWESLGQFPLDDRPPLRPRITGTLDHGDHWVQKIVYQSLPGLYVTAVAYVPKQIDGRVPAVICVNGHWPQSKATPDVQRRCAGLARMGVIAFCQDVIGTGERAAPPGTIDSSYHGNYRGAVSRIVDRSLLGYVMYECIRALDYLLTRSDVDPQRVMCTGSSGGGKQSMFFPALDDRLAGGVPVCYIGNYQVHMGATACVGEVPTHVLRYTNQWEILGLHAPRPLLCINASQDIEVFQPRYMQETLRLTSERIGSLYGAEAKIEGKVVDSPHAYNRPMRELLYNHVARYLLGQQDPQISEPDDLPVESPDALVCGMPPGGATMQSLTFHRARQLVGSIRTPKNLDQYVERKAEKLERLEMEIFGGFPPADQAGHALVREFPWKGHRVEHWDIQPEPGISVPAVLCSATAEDDDAKRPAVLVVDERGKQFAFGRGLVEPLVEAGNVVLLIDYRGAGETAGTVPQYASAPDYNLSNYSLFCGRPLTGMRVHDVRCAVDFLAQRPEVDATRIAFCGRGIAALTGVMAAALDDRIRAVVAEEMLTTWVFAEEFNNIGLSYLIPRILTLGDVQHWAACVAGRPLLFVNPVDGQRRAVSVADWRSAHHYTRAIYGLHGESNRIGCVRDDVNNVPARLVEWLGEHLRP